MQPYTILVYGDDCLYPQNPAIGLGICAAIFLVVAQITFSAVGGCCGCCRSRAIPSETKRIVSIVCAVFSWSVHYIYTIGFANIYSIIIYANKMMEPAHVRAARARAG
jgi:hypothetical protein